jgi:hypothetical protein
VNTLFSTTRRLMALDVFRTPQAVAHSTRRELERLWARDDGPCLLWPRSPGDDAPPVAAWLGPDDDCRIPIFARVVPDAAAEAMLARHGGKWSRLASVAGAGGTWVGSIWKCDEGSVFLPFDPDEVQLNYLTERYREILIGRRADRRRRLALRCYYRIRGYLPKALQIWLRRRYAPIQARAAFPRWPIEAGLHDFWDFLYSILAAILGEPVPRIAAWPNGAAWALVLTHDVETARGLANIDAVASLERSLGYRSSWNFVPCRDYDVGPERVGSLVRGGFEVGVHGLRHDGRDLASPTALRERLPAMREAAARWEAAGFRSPSTQRGWNLMAMLGFDYDSSYPDTDPFEPQAGGSCTWLPFFIDEMVELPGTLTQDHTLFVILRHQDETVWVEKADFLRARGGMALMLTHPDYLTDTVVLEAYRRFLERFADDPSVWKALPREVSAWWRRRAASSLERAGTGWSVSGPASPEARVELVAAGAGWLTRLGTAAGVDRAAERQLVA